jgi:hypothetical protein
VTSKDGPSSPDDKPEDEQPSLTRRLLDAGPDAPKVLVQAAVTGQLESARRYADTLTGNGTVTDLDDLTRRVIRAHRRLARSEGAAAGLATSAAEMTTVFGTAGTTTLPALAVTLTGDLIGLAWIQTRMVLIIAALHGHDMSDGKERVKELLTLAGLQGSGATIAAEQAAARSQRVLKRLLLRYLRGEPLRAITAMFRLVGIRFARAGVIRLLPLVNIPVNALVSDAATRAVGKKAAEFYAELPAPHHT